jgi:broad specificity phosphatase PhoE
MGNKFIFIRHAEVVKDPTKHPSQWVLTPDALITIDKYIKNGTFDEVTRIYSSTENKAIATGRPISDLLGIEIVKLDNFVELKRKKDFLSEEQFLDQKRRELEHLDDIENGVESASVALKRFQEGIDILESKFNNVTILVISHGTIMTLYFADLLGHMSNAFARWQRLKFCALGVVSDGRVVEDIV